VYILLEKWKIYPGTTNKVLIMAAPEMANLIYTAYPFEAFPI